ncbi:hypothetical protein SDC9_174704 [bioreactor metagenome]|uniref:Uncharacterized protein n=1 Tax=bioreactor metagenome TaxID=1076179 RepID=A0A645GTC5_9ZZZZ
MLVVCPERIARDVRDQNWLAAKCSGSTGAGIRTDWGAVERVRIGRRQAGGCQRAQALVIVDTQDCCGDLRGDMLHLGTDQVHHLGQ